MKCKRIAALLLACAMGLSLVACGGNAASEAASTSGETSEASTASQPVEEEPAASEELDPEENYETGDASLDDPLNQDGIGENELLVVSFGTSYNDNRRLTVGAIEKAMQEGYSTASEEARSLGFGAGMGLPNMKKYTDEMNIETEIGVGTKITMVVNI